MCKGIIKHEHPLKEYASDLVAQKQLAIKNLLHACVCREEQCKHPNCTKMKSIVDHSKICRRKTTGECSTCKPLLALCYYHAKQCNEVWCQIPNCQRFKDRFAQQRRIQREKQEETMLRHVTFMIAEEQ